ncbi:MAG TPA: antitoxin Xre/MbcA/ParS toxin-binding domain-containing protein [Guyparkeria sp.]|nr:antitoxin Xre/MbcA/ParS toxin-binding domain-containing protein [Guyparkeria sp.]
MDASSIEPALLDLLGASSGARADALIRVGIPLSALDQLRRHGVNPTDIGIISQRALKQRLSQGKSLTHSEGDHLYRVGRIIILAEATFSNQKKALLWLQKPRNALGRRSALQAASTTAGLLAAEELLVRLKHGFAA